MKKKKLVLCLFVICLISVKSCSRKSYMDVNELFPDKEGITCTEDSVSFDERHTAKLFSDCEVAAGEGFVVSYTVQGNDPEYLYANSGGLYVEYEDEVEEEIEGFGKKLWHNVIIFHDPWGQTYANATVYIIENSPYGKKDDGAYYNTDMPFAKASNPVTVTIVYYEEAYYIELDHSCTIKLTADMVPNFAERVDVERFFGTGARKIGFRAAGTGATFSKVNYSIGNEAAKAAIEEMDFKK